MKTLVWVGLLAGSTIGGFLPMLWGENSLFSMSSILLSSVGAIFGIWLGWKIGQGMDIS